MAKNFFTSRETISFSKRSLLHGIGLIDFLPVSIKKHKTQYKLVITINYKESNEVLVKLRVSLIITEQCEKAIACWFHRREKPWFREWTSVTSFSSAEHWKRIRVKSQL